MPALIHPFTSLPSRIPSCKIRSASRYRLTFEGVSEMLDAICDMWHVNFGYSCKPIQEKMAAQLREPPASSLISSNYAVAEETAERLRKFLQRHRDRVSFTNSGAEAVEAARRIVDLCASAHGATQARIAYLPRAFHGNTGREQNFVRNERRVRG